MSQTTSPAAPITRPRTSDQAAGEISAPPARKIICRYRRRNNEMCTAPALDQSPDALIYVCMKHGARVVKLVMDRQRELQAGGGRG